MKPVKEKQTLKLGSQTNLSVIDSDKKKSNGVHDNLIDGTRLFIQASEMGFSIALPPVLGAFFGLWLDKQFGSKPLLTLTCLLFGSFLSFAKLFKEVSKYKQK